MVDEEVFLEATGTKYGLADVAEQLFWISAALQTPTHAPGIVKFCSSKCSTTSFTAYRSTTDHPSGRHAGTLHCLVEPDAMDIVDPETGNNCWYNLFGQVVVVLGYPIVSRSVGFHGLEIPFSMMAALACADRITSVYGTPVVKGLSTLLYPTHIETDYMFWHLLYNEDGSRISFTDERVPYLELTNGMRLQPQQIGHSRNIVGWSREIKMKVGM
jgi:hypothetical protein